MKAITVRQIASSDLPQSKRRKMSDILSNSLNIGFIGGGNLARSITEGLLTSNERNKKNFYASFTSITSENCKKMQALGINVTTSNKDIVMSSDVIVISVKPHQVMDVLNELQKLYEDLSTSQPIVGSKRMPKNMRPLIVSVATAITLKDIEEKTKISWNIGGSPMVGHLPVVRCLPTVACSVRAGVTVYSGGRYCTEQDLKSFLDIFSYCGYCEEVPEKYIDSFTAFSGSGIAFMGMALEAMADGGVLVGIPRSMADKIAAYTMISAAKMVIERGHQPSEIKSLVASPGGTTIHGLKVMEDSGVRSGIMGAVQRATERAIELRPKQT